MNKPRIGTYEWDEVNPHRYGIFNVNYDGEGKWDGTGSPTPWIVSKGTEVIKGSFASVHEASEFLRRKLSETP